MKVWAVLGNLNVNLTDTTLMAFSAGYLKSTNDPTYDKIYSIGGVLAWKPVDALQFGVAANYYHYKFQGGGTLKVLGAGLAGWYFF